jgi:hypothetical protein
VGSGARLGQTVASDWGVVVEGGREGVRHRQGFPRAPLLPSSPNG